MKKIITVIFLSSLLTGCASFPFKITGWNTPNHFVDERGHTATIVGNPRITCKTAKGILLADGYFVTVDPDNYLVVDEFGKGYILIPNKELDTYCKLWEQN